MKAYLYAIITLFFAFILSIGLANAGYVEKAQNTMGGSNCRLVDLSAEK